MLEEIKRSEWGTFFSKFNERNEMRPTRLEVMGEEGKDNALPEVEADFWVEDGLPLLGVSLEPEGEGAPRVEIMLGGQSAKPHDHLTHTITGAQRVRRTLDDGGRESELEIEDKDGALTVLHF